ncbi:pentatricopeptide repeat-containing protein At3g58590-like isoform X2 [Rhododendron vialii]|nr:pentatricopeptide repeat-containing protein At3g58590-like isoform X2 [Rhododendron vialii]
MFQQFEELGSFHEHLREQDHLFGQIRSYILLPLSKLKVYIANCCHQSISVTLNNTYTQSIVGRLVCMRKATSSRSVRLLFNLTKIRSISPPMLLTVPLQRCHSQHTIAAQHFHGEFHHQCILLQLLQEFPRIKSLDAPKSLHALAITTGWNCPQPIFLNNNIISAYASFGELFLARKVFDEMPRRNTVSYNTMIGCYSRCGDAEEAWKLFFEMRLCGYEPTQFTFGGLLSCQSLDLYRGFYLQALVLKSGLLYPDAFAGTALLGLFGKHGCLDECLKAFEDMPRKNLVTWNTMISLFGHHGFAEESIVMFRKIMKMEWALTEYSYVGVLSGFLWERDLELGEQVHGLLVKNGLVCNVLVLNALLNMYVKCSGPCIAEKVFGEASIRDVVSWNTIIGALTKSESPGKALEVYLKMCLDGVWPNRTTFVSVISSCTRSENLMYGKLIHGMAIKHMLDRDIFVGSALVDLYAKTDWLGDAQRCFDDIDEKNVVSWNALIWGYSQKCCFSPVQLLCEMIQFGCQPNELSFSTLLKSSNTVELQQLHSLIIKMGYHGNEYVSCSLITSYAKSGLISDALILLPADDTQLPVVPSNVIAGIYNRTGQYHKTQELYSLLEEPDIVSWNILIAACSRNGDYKEAFELLGHMRVAQIHPDKYTYVSLLSVCTNLCNLALGSSLHGLIIKTDSKRCDTFVSNIIIDMYGKCGSLESCLKIFDEMADRNLISWTVVIATLGLHGQSYKALQMFREMEAVGFTPDRIAFLAVLSACRHGGLVKEGKQLFGEMNMTYRIEPDFDHYHLMVDLLTRYGDLKEAERLPFPPNALIWRRFLEACNRQRNAENLEVDNVNLESSG